MKQWVTVETHKGYNIQILDHAEVGDCMDYRIDPPLPGQHRVYSTVGDAFEAIEKYGVT